jgi:hypothetical protein
MIGIGKDESLRSFTKGEPATGMDQRGVVIIVVLWICALIMWFALQIGVETRLRGEEQVHQLRRSQALHLAIGGCYEALARMGQPLLTGLEDDATLNWQPDGLPRIVDYQNGQALVIIEPETENRVNVNMATRDQLAAVFERAGLELDPSDELADMILDFIDEDDLQRLHGAEASKYEQMGLHYGPFNHPLVSLDQLLLIPGMTQQLFYAHGLQFANEDRRSREENETLNLPMLPGKNSLFQMLTVYGNNTTLRDDEIEDPLMGNIVTWQPGETYRILSVGATHSRSSTVVIWLIVRNAPESEKGYEVLYRKIL